MTSAILVFLKLDTKLVKVSEDDSQFDGDLAHGRGSQPVPVGAGDEDVGVSQLVAAPNVELRYGVSQAAAGSPGGHL